MATMDRPTTSGTPASATMPDRVQTVEPRDGGVGEHTHPATTHTHDHYHLSHLHKDGPFGEWEHRTYWHTHEHNHSELTHGHDYKLEDEDANHAREAHVHDHTEPAHSHA